MNSTERFATVRTKISEVIAKATTMYGVNLSNLSLKLNTRGKVAGLAKCKYCNGGNLYTLRFNQDMILNDSFEYILNDTVPHEIAHLVCFADPSLGRNHNYGWQRVCIALGGNGKRCHNEEVEYAHGGFDYLSDTGHKVTVSKIIHQKIQAGRRYIFRGGKGKVNNQQPFCVQGGVMPTVAPKPLAPPAPPTITSYPWGDVLMVARPTVARSALDGSMSKAEQVRIWIREAKRTGNTQESVANKAVANLSMSRAQATRYVLENWMKA